ncbi:lysylphosphatidylglycerol synthase transmembrane domain-containing protein [Haloplanus halophilus]|uniref:lysylphosphatidylglycerol synthase transmembrane domain-containing protein n=1 Tax=Haloplanus halophilus TaxID=2949993 RepID=UPI002040E5CB|nr:flippase-like domain-containing protein [Haloplanus sp. GDY1]
MAGGRLRATVLGFAGALVVFAVLFSLAGVDDLLAQLANADLRLVGLVFLVTLGWLAAWGFALRTVLDVLGVSLSVPEALFVFTGAMFANNVTPFGQAGGEPITALLISRVADTEYETGLAAIASVDTLNFVPSITIALIGVGYFVTETAFGTSRRLELALVAVIGLAVGVPALVYLGWQRRYRLERRVVGLVTPAVRRVARHVPRMPVPTVGGIEGRINGFFRAIERVAANPRGLAVALALSSVGWFFQMLGLWLAFRAIGTPIPLSVALFVVPIGAIAGVTPLPGGAGGIESVLVVLLVAAPLPTVTEPIALAAVVVFRGMVYWTPTVLGGLATGVVGVRS